jgi:hypothetical protein
MISFNRWPPPVIPTVEEELLYPASDEVKLAESTRQFDKIVLLYNFITTWNCFLPIEQMSLSPAAYFGIRWKHVRRSIKRRM